MNRLLAFLALLWRWLDFLAPRFLTEEVAMQDFGWGLEVACPLSMLEPGDKFDAIATIRGFNLFGVMIFPKIVGEIRPFVNPHKERQA